MADEPVRPSNWLAAILASLRCPECTAENRPGASYLEILPDGQVWCSVCSKSTPLALALPPNRIAAV